MLRYLGRYWNLLNSRILQQLGNAGPIEWLDFKPGAKYDPFHLTDEGKPAPIPPDGE